jgi:3-methyladenine DNA glycosylase AlkD
MTAQEIIRYMESQRNDEQRAILMRFFKTAPGEYGDGDEFLGLKVPQTRDVVESVAQGFPLSEIPALLTSRWHEVRLCGLLILVNKFEKLATRRLANDEKAIRGRDEILTMYLQYAEQANNWDLVDLSVHKILGHWLLLPSNLGDRDYKIKVLDDLAASDCLWKQRMSMVCSWKTSQQGDPSWCLRYADIHLHHPHDLMHKAVGWMLREMGKRVSMDLLRDFLRQHAHEMPRTMLRYAIEKMPESERKEWMEIPMEKNLSPVSKVTPFAGLSIPLFVDVILHDDQQSDEAVYYLLHRRLNRPLYDIFQIYHRQLPDDFEDIIEDFFLYLREGKDGRNRFPYQSLQNIRRKEAFETWMLKTFRNYLSNRAYEEERITGADCTIDGLPADSTPASSLTDEPKLFVVAQLIAYALQVFYPRGRFIFLRSLLTMLNKKQSLPNEDVAEALGMTAVSYRVTVHRMKCNLSKFRRRLQQGERLRLDAEHQQMAQHIYDDFVHLYPTLLAYYTQIIDTLKCADAIKHLRQKYYEATGLMAHEPDSNDLTPTTIKAFWNKLNRLLIV